jgi:hypothetical protein
VALAYVLEASTSQPMRPQVAAPPSPQPCVTNLIGSVNNSKRHKTVNLPATVAE